VARPTVKALRGEAAYRSAVFTITALLRFSATAVFENTAVLASIGENRHVSYLRFYDHRSFSRLEKMRYS